MSRVFLSGSIRGGLRLAETYWFMALHGFSPGDRYRIGEAVEQELSRILADEGMAAVAGTWRRDCKCGWWCN
jgi:hypothetical protein